jgi:hypothetical protein
MTETSGGLLRRVAVPLPETIRTIEYAVCSNCEENLVRAIPPSGQRGAWWHEVTGFVSCPGADDD